MEGKADGQVDADTIALREKVRQLRAQVSLPGRAVRPAVVLMMLSIRLKVWDSTRTTLTAQATVVAVVVVVGDEVVLSAAAVECLARSSWTIAPG
jgi:hypothetical protein